MRDGRGQLAERRHLLHVQDLTLGAAKLARLLGDSGLQGLGPLAQRGLGPSEILGHPVEVLPEPCELVSATDVHSRLEVSPRQLPRAFL